MLPLIQAPVAQEFHPFSYTTIELEVFRTDLDDFSEDSDGVSLTGTLGFAEHFFVIGAASTQSLDVPGFGDLDVDTVGGGLGGHVPLGERTDLVGYVVYQHAEAEFQGLEDSDDQWNLAVTARHWLAPRFELDGGLGVADVGDESETGFLAGARFYVTDRVSLGAGLQIFDESDTLSFGVRVDF